METCTAGSASGLGKRTSSNAGTAPQADSSLRPRPLPMSGRGDGDSDSDFAAFEEEVRGPECFAGSAGLLEAVGLQGAQCVVE
jgi:hypothetical protein